MKELIKDIIILLALLALVGVTLAIVFYDAIPYTRTVPNVAQRRELPAEVRDILDSAPSQEEDATRRTFTTSEDLRPLEAQVERGKVNPFAPNSGNSPTEGGTQTGNPTGGTSGNPSNSNSTNSNPNNSNTDTPEERPNTDNVGNFFEDDGK